MKLATTKFKSGGPHEKHVVATWNVGNHLSVCFYAQGNQKKTCVEVAGRSKSKKVKKQQCTHSTANTHNYNNTHGQPTTITQKKP